MTKTKTMRNVTKAFFLILALMLAGGLAMGIAHALPPNHAFELDRNADDPNGVDTPPDDWETVFRKPAGSLLTMTLPFLK